MQAVQSRIIISAHRINQGIDECFIVRDANGHALADVYFEEAPGGQAAAKLFNRDEAWRIANVAKPPELPRS
jgi:hypothetical protein